MALDFEHFIGINTIPNGVIFHPNNQKYLFAAGGNVVIGDLTDPHAQEFLRKHDDKVSCIALSRSGRFIASGQTGENSNVHIWDFESKRVLYTFEEHDHCITAVCFSEDEKTVATIGNSDDRKLIVWDMSTGNVIAASTKLPLGTNCIAHGGFVRDVKRRDTDHYLLCTAGKEGLLLWDLDPFSGELHPFKLAGDARATLTREITSISFSLDKEFIYGATTTGDYVVASMRSTRIIQAVQATKLGLGALLAFDGGVVVGCGDSTIKVFDSNYEFRGQAVLDGPVLGLSFSPDRLEALALTKNGTIVRINIANLQFIIISESHTAAVTAVSFSVGRTDRFATASRDGTIRVWDSAEYVVIATCTARREMDRGVTPLCLAYSDIILSGWTDGKVLAHAETGESLWFIDNAHQGGVSVMTLSHNRRFILTGGPAGEVRLWELRSRDLISHLAEHRGKVTSLVLSEDDTVAITASRDRCILRWDLRQEKRVFCHMQRMGGINGIVLSKDETQILSVGQEKRLVYWKGDVLEAQHQQFLDGTEDGESDEGRVIAISHNGQLLATGGTGGILRLWDYNTASLIAEAAGHSQAINSMAFAPDDKQIITVGEDGSIFFWVVFDRE